MKKNIPNFITLLNLLCGCLASVSIIKGDILWSAAFVFFGTILDFMDGFVARLLKVDSNLGKELDSLADVVTFGLVPGLMMRQLLMDSFVNYPSYSIFLSNLGLLITLFSAFRLAKFNIDDKQRFTFIGLPTPANAFFIASLLLTKYLQPSLDFMTKLLSNPFILIAITLWSSWIMNSKISLFTLKFKTFGFKKNAFQYSLVITSVILILSFGYLGITLSILLYILLSLLRTKRLS